MELLFLSNWVTIIAFIVNIGSIIVLLGIILLFWRNYRNSKSNFTLGLLFFAILVLIEPVGDLASLIKFNQVDNFQFISNIFQLIGFIIFFRLAMK